VETDAQTHKHTHKHAARPPSTDKTDHRLRGRAALFERRRQFPMGKMETLTPCKIETLKQIDTQFVRIDYVLLERNVCSKFGKNPFTGD